MPSIKRIGFFHFGENNKADPVRSLEEEVARHSPSALKDSLIVLPEAFNARGGLYQPDPELDPDVCSAAAGSFFLPTGASSLSPV